MARSLTKDDIAELGTAERLDLIAALWDSLSPSDIPLPESHRKAIDAALEEHAADPAGAQQLHDGAEEEFPFKLAEFVSDQQRVTTYGARAIGMSFSQQDWVFASVRSSTKHFGGLRKTLWPTRPSTKRFAER
jgi:putative addiction module component (TIGR02574 family)